MPKTGRDSPEIRERTMRLVFEHEHEHSSQWKAICSIASKTRSVLRSARIDQPTTRREKRSSTRRRDRPGPAR